jgi:hypothetical protein
MFALHTEIHWPVAEIVAFEPDPAVDPFPHRETTDLIIEGGEWSLLDR